MDTKFERFNYFTKYEYRDVSKPNQTLRQRIKNSRKLFWGKGYLQTFLIDMKYLIENQLTQHEDRKNLNNCLRVYRAGELGIVFYCLNSIYWHFKQGYFAKGSRLLEGYIIGKIIFIMSILAFGNFLVFKTISDPTMYKYFLQKEEEWDTHTAKNIYQSKDTRDYIKLFSEKNDNKLNDKKNL